MGRNTTPLDTVKTQRSRCPCYTSIRQQAKVCRRKAPPVTAALSIFIWDVRAEALAVSKVGAVAALVVSRVGAVAALAVSRADAAVAAYKTPRVPRGIYYKRDSISSF